MFLSRLSLRVNLAVSVFVMGLLGVVLAVLVAESYRQFAIDSQRSTSEQIVSLRVGDLLGGLSRTSHELGQAIQSGKKFRTMFRARDTASMTQYLQSQFHQFFVTTGVIKLESLIAYDAEFNPLAVGISDATSPKAGCPSLHEYAKKRTGPERLKNIHELCLVDGRPYFSMVHPIGGLRVTGYLEVVTDPVYTLRAIEDDLGMPMHVEYLDGSTAYQSIGWPDDSANHRYLKASYQPITDEAYGAFTLSVAQDLTEFEQKLNVTRNTNIAIVGGVGLLIALLMIFWLDKTALVPLHRLGVQLDSVRRDKSQLGKQVAVKGNAEARKLAAGFNEMTNELKNLYDTLLANNEELNQEIGNRENVEKELKKHRDHLEETVKQRTLDLADARDAALEASRTKSLFLANMSHELRTPLNAIIGYSEMLIEEAEDEGEDKFIPDLLKVSSAGKHLLSLISGILDLTKIEAGKMDIFEEWFDVRGLLNEVMDTFSPMIKENQNTLGVICSDDVGYMFADMTKVRQAIYNLVGNAGKFTSGGLVQITVDIIPEGGAECISFRVKDTGIGMTRVQQKNIFEPFAQADASTTRQFGGTGLGLVISKRLCEMMDGNIFLESEKDKGSTFTIMLPVKGKTWSDRDGDAPE